MHDFVLPSRNLFGAGAVSAVGPSLAAMNIGRVLVVTDRGLAAHDLHAPVLASLAEAGVEAEVIAELQGEPSLFDVDTAVARYRATSCEAIVGFGGGSANDCAKATGIAVANPEPLRTYQGLNRTPNPSVPLILVNTTAGTASEISRAYLLTEPDSGHKLIFKDHHAMAALAINDPELMVGLPPNVTAATGMDALTHALEAYVSTGTFLLVQKLAQSAVELIFEHLPLAVAHPHLLEHREAMITAQSLAGMAFGNAGVGLVHAMAHPLGSTFHLPHGICNAVLLPHVMRFNASTVTEAYADLARRIRVPGTAGAVPMAAAHLLISQVEALSQAIGTAVPLRDLGVQLTDFDDLAAATLAEPNLPRNPVQPSEGDVVGILRAAW